MSNTSYDEETMETMEDMTEDDAHGIDAGRPPIEFAEAEVVEAPKAEPSSSTALAVIPALAQAQPLVPFNGVSRERFTAEQEAILTAPATDEEICILPTGELYVPQIRYRMRLNKAFGVGAWALVPMSDPVKQGNTVCQRWHMMVQGRFVAEAWGEQDYNESNSRTSYATSLESAKSNGLTRCCKDMGVALEMWDRKWSRAWIAEHAVQVQVKGWKGLETQWRLKDDPPLKGEIPAGPAPKAATPPPAPAAPPAQPAGPQKGSGLVSAITEKKNKEDKTYFLVTIGTVTARTFSTTAEKELRMAWDMGLVVEFTYQTDQWGARLLNYEIKGEVE